MPFDIQETPHLVETGRGALEEAWVETTNLLLGRISLTDGPSFYKA